MGKTTGYFLPQIPLSSVITKEKQMNTVKITNGMIIKNNETNIRYRVLNVTNDFSTLINLDTINKCDIIPLGNKLIYKQISENKYTVIEEPEDNTVIDIELLSESQKIKFNLKKLIIDAVNKLYAPDYTGLLGRKPKPELEEIIKTSKMTKAAVRRIIIKYLQSGCKDSSLLRTRTTLNTKGKDSKNKRGRVSEIEERNGKNLTDKDRKIMMIYIKKKLNNNQLTIQKCYDDMVIEHYTREQIVNGTIIYEELPQNQRPTIYQLWYYYYENTTQEQRISAKIGKREYRNQRRPLTGTALNGVRSPCDICEMDACELDISVVSTTDPSKTVGSPVVYFLVDVYSHLIIAASISFENNSIVGMTNCLASLVEDKESVLNALGIKIKTTEDGMTLTDIMPTYIKPSTIRFDNGADFKSKEAQRIAQELNIIIDYAPPATGSLKSIVERSFRSFQSNFLDMTLGYGTKNYSNGRSKHNEEATLTIYEVQYLMYSFIIEYNTTQHRSSYNLTPDMVKNNIGRIPAEIWRYGIQHAGNPATITDKLQYLYALLTPDTAKITRLGIIYEKLRYIPENNDSKIYDTMVSVNHGSKPIKIRIDQRSTKKIYYINENNQICTASMVKDIVHEEIALMTWPEYRKHLNDQRLLLAEKQTESDKTRRAHRRNNKEIIKEAKAKSGKQKNDNKNIRENRLTEKSKIDQELSFDNRFGLATTTLPKTAIETKANAIKDTPEKEITKNETNIIIPKPNTEEERTKNVIQIAMEMAEKEKNNKYKEDEEE